MLAVVLIGLIAPFINAARFTGAIKSALETSLGRKVAFEKAYFTLFSGPGFALENVTIAEDPQFGLEPFAYVPTLEARLRLDKLLLGQIQFASFRLVDPSLNLVKQDRGGSWNIVQLVQRLSVPRRAPLSLFASFEVSDGRVDLKFGTRKNTLYISNADLSIYPERSGRIYIRFSGSPARTDRAGMGFGHFRGDLNWFSASAAKKANQIEGEVNLDPSNLSELTTLVEGHDVGVHGTVSSKLKIAGNVSALHLAGEVRLDDVHRWDLLPSPGEDWTVRYAGILDARSHRLDLKTVPAKDGHLTPVAVRFQLNDFLGQSSSSIIADFKDAPLAGMLPLAVRMGVPFPSGVVLQGDLNGAIGYSNEAGWSGGVILSNAKAAISDSPPLEALSANLTVYADRLHLDPTPVAIGETGAATVSADYSFSNQSAQASLNAADVPAGRLKSLTESWFGSSAALAAVSNGAITGRFSFTHNGDVSVNSDAPPNAYSGLFELASATMTVPGLAIPLRDLSSRVIFSDSSFAFDHLTAKLGNRTVRASYRYNALAKHSERARIEFATADLSELEDAIAAPRESDGLWARLRLLRRSVPAWLSARNLEGDLVVEDLLADGKSLGSLSSHFLWQGSSLECSNARLHLSQGQITSDGTVNLDSSVPRWQFAAKASGFPWNGGMLSAEGHFASTGAGRDLLRNLTADGSFTGQDLALSPENTFESVSGLFSFSFGEGWPNLRISNIQATQNGDEWTGQANAQSDGRLLVNLAHAGREMHFESSLAGAAGQNPLTLLPRSPSAATDLRSKLEF